MNCIMVLTEMLAEEGGMATNQPLIHHLLTRINEFNEWGLIQVRVGPRTELKGQASTLGVRKTQIPPATTYGHAFPELCDW